jgi:uncharacterized protein YuzE
MKKLDFNIRVEVDSETGEALAVYLRVRSGKAFEVRELEEGKVFANYDRNGLLLGIELLAPCKITLFDRITVSEPKEVREFIKRTIPREMAIVA